MRLTNQQNRVLLRESFSVHSASNRHMCESSGSPGYLVESVGEKLTVKLPVTSLDTRNENGRVYPSSIMESSCRLAEAAMKERRLLCTVDGHPEEPYVEPGNASHVVTRAWCEGKHLWNEWEVLGTSKGKDLKALIESNISFGVSIRGVGSCDNYGTVLDDYEYLGTDCVGEPSAKIWVAPEIVNSNKSSQRISESSSSSISRNNNMSNQIELRNYIKEQHDLIKAEPDVTSKFQRASLVEQTLSSKMNSMPISEAVYLMTEWNKHKDSALNTADKKDATIKSLTSQLNEASIKLNKTVSDERKKVVMMKTVLEKTVKNLNEKTAKLEEANKKLAKVATVSVQTSKDKSQKLNEAKTALMKAHKSLLLKEKRIAQATSTSKKLNKLIISEAADLVKTSIKEGASLLREASKKTGNLSARRLRSEPTSLSKGSLAEKKVPKANVDHQSYAPKMKYKGSRVDNPTVI